MKTDLYLQIYISQQNDTIEWWNLMTKLWWGGCNWGCDDRTFEYRCCTAIVIYFLLWKINITKEQTHRPGIVRRNIKQYLGHYLMDVESLIYNVVAI